METFRDKARAFLYAFVVHVLCIGALFIGLLWTQSEVHPINLPGPVIDVDLVGITAAPKPQSRPKQAPKPAPPKTQPEPVKPPEPQPQAPTDVQRQDRIDREKIAEIAQEKADKDRAEEERHKQEQVLLQQQKQLERDLEKAKRDREKAQRQVALEKQALEQMKDLKNQKPVKTQSLPVPPAEQAVTGNEGHDDSRDALYFAAIQNAVTNNWLRPDTAQGGLHCMIHIIQIPGGDVIAAQVTNPCNADPLTRTSIEQAVKRASPLPYKGFDKEFRREFNFNFTYDG